MSKYFTRYLIMEKPASNGDFHLPYEQSLQTSRELNLAFDSSKVHLEVENSDVSNVLHLYRKGGYPEYTAYKWYDWIQEIGKASGPASSSGVLEWRQERAQMILSFLGQSQRHKLLNVGFKTIKRDIKVQKIVLQDIDNTKYFVVYEVLRGNPEIAFALLETERPAILTAASSRFLKPLVCAIQTLEAKIRLIGNITTEEAKERLFNKLSVSDGSTNTVLGFAVLNGDVEMVSMLLGQETRLANERYLNDNHIKGALKKGAKDIMEKILEARPALAKSLPELIIKAGGSHCLDMWTALNPYFEQDLESSDDILHLAVQQMQLGIIDWLVCKYPQMATRQDNGNRIALSYNNDQDQYSRDGLVKDNIRSSIVPAIIRFQKPAASQKLLLDADGELVCSIASAQRLMMQQIHVGTFHRYVGFY